MKINELYVLAVLILLRGFANGMKSRTTTLSPPYTCTTTCQPGVIPQNHPIDPVNIAQGRVGKMGESGTKGEKGDPCHCNAANETFIKYLAQDVEKLNILAALNHRIGSPINLAKSCLHLKQEGQIQSGIYTIQTAETSSAIQVFCDMTSAGGGWTLVASIHENNIEGKCTAGDLWSSDQGDASKAYLGNGNWENYNTFGTPEGSTSADYKSEAFFSLRSSDVMIWHVPNNMKIHEAHHNAMLMYYTNTSFLSEYGGTLQSMFKNYYPLQKIEKEFQVGFSVDDQISFLNQTAPTIRNLIPGFYSYIYDGGDTKIADGGNDMYDNGNKLFYQIGKNNGAEIQYNIKYRNEQYDVDLFSGTSHPFNLLAWIGGEGAELVESFGLKVIGDPGADGSGSFRTVSGKLISGNFAVMYHVFNVHGATDPSISKVFYIISNVKEWNSIVPSVTRSPWTSGTTLLEHGIVLGTNPQRVLIGYTLLSRSAGAEVSNSHILSVLQKVLSVVRNGALLKCNHLDKSVVQPVTYIRGNDVDILSGIPVNEKSKTTPGFVQFRSYNSIGLPNAICPGIRTTSCSSESICVGGINTMPYDQNSCGDFAGWGGAGGDSLQKTTPTNVAKSLNDIHSSILIFTRK